MPEWFYEMAPSDWNMVIFGLLILVFVIDYGFWSPWWTHPIGWIVLIYGISVLALVFLILYGMVAGQRVDEWARFTVTLMLDVGIIGKIVILHYERKQGQKERLAMLHARRSRPVD